MDDSRIEPNTDKIQLEKDVLEYQSTYYSALKQKALDSLWIFNRHVLDVEKDKASLGLFQKELCNFIQENTKKKKLILIPRGHLKSTLVTIGYSVQQIVKNPNIRILILNATWQMAVDFLTEIKRHLTQNQLLIDLFGNIADSPPEWSQDRITVKRTNMNIKGPTVWATGIESNLTGSHPDLIILDDVVSRDNTQSREMIEKVILRYKDSLDLLEPGGQLIVIGTRWTDSDFYSWILEKENNISESYDIFLKQSYTGDLYLGEDFHPLWGEKFNRKELQDRQREKGWYEFSAQYQNNPVPDEDADFKKEWFQYYHVEEYRGAKMNSVLTIDPAISLKKEADFTAMAVTAIDQFRNLFVKDLVRGHWKPSNIIDMIFYLFELWHPHAVLVETVSYQKALAYALQDEMRKRGRFLPVLEKSYQERTKAERIRALQHLYEKKAVYHRKELKLTPYLEDELRKFPRGKHDDLADVVAMSLDYLTPPVQTKTRYHHKYLY